MLPLSKDHELAAEDEKLAGALVVDPGPPLLGCAPAEGRPTSWSRQFAAAEAVTDRQLACIFGHYCRHSGAAGPQTRRTYSAAVCK